MKKVKRIISTILAVIMILGLCACQGGKKNTGDGKLLWYIPGETQTDQATVSEVLNAKFKETVGNEVEIKYVSDGSFNEKMRMIMAAREEFDLCFTGYNNPYLTAVDAGGLYDITELVEKSKLPEVLPETIFDVAKVNGKIYGVPNQQIFALPYALVVRKDLAEKYNLDMSDFTKTTDIEPFLETIKNNEPNYIPFSAYHKLNSFWSMEDDREYSVKDWVTVKAVGENDWEIESFDKAMDKMYAKAKVMSDWYKKGYIRKDVDTVQDEVSEMAAGKYAVTFTGYKPGVESELKTQLNGDVVVKVVGPTAYNIDFPLQTMISVSATTKNPEGAVKVIEAVNTDTNLYNTLCYGVEGKHYNKTGDNRVEIIPDSGYEPNAAWKFGNNFNAWLTPEQSDDCHEQSKQINASAKIIGIPGFVFDDSKVKMELTQIATVKSKYMGIQLGSANLDTAWNEYVSELKKAGIEKIYEEVDRQINEFEKTLSK